MRNALLTLCFRVFSLTKERQVGQSQMKNDITVLRVIFAHEELFVFVHRNFEPVNTTRVLTSSR